MIRLIVEVRGIVQGVGFRPFVLRTARELGLAGSVVNQGGGVHIVCEGGEENCQALLDRLQNAPPPGAMIFSVETAREEPRGEGAFRILPSAPGAAEVAVSPDLGICDDCARELLDPADRRYRYPFLNCTACGPRFTIVRDIPYDRANTTMDAFPMCPDCAREYGDPENRRFHAQPTACPVCGPRLRWLENGEELDGDPVARFADAIRAGKVIAVKGLGGYHLACDAANEAAVRRVRDSKHRYAKPLALMVRDLAAAEELCAVTPEERAELLSPRKPIVLLQKREDCGAAPSVAPDNTRLGVMLPYTPLHILLTRQTPPLVMTSANVSDLPMPYREEDEGRILPLCDALLTHNRPILRRMDDSVCQFAGGARRLLRRARGFAPEPIALPGGEGQILAFGAQLKNTFCLAKGGRAYLSGHIGDLDDWETGEFCQREIESFLRLFDGRPQVLAHDAHPDYASTRMAQAWARRHPGARLMAVQHHHAHFAACLLENGHDGQAIGVLFDGTGYGPDGTIWGGEFFVGDASGYRRLGHLFPSRLPGGDASVREPWRYALALLSEAFGEEASALGLSLWPEEAERIHQILSLLPSSPVTTSCGRLFDGAAALLGIGATVSYDGQAAMELEGVAWGQLEAPFLVEERDAVLLLDWRPAVRWLLEERQRLSVAELAGGIHRGLARGVLEVCRRIRERTGLETVALSGGVWQNRRLLAETVLRLRRDGFTPLLHRLVPPNDECVSVGQVAVGASRWRR